MDALTARQSQLGKEIERLANTYFAESPDKKTLAYLKDRLVKLEDAWTEFEEHDNVIREKYSTSLNHQYFQTDYYNVVKEMFTKVTKEIKKLITTVENHQKEVEPKQSDKTVRPRSADSQERKNQDDTIIKLIKNQQGMIATLERALTNITAITEVQSKQYYQVKTEIIKKYWKNIEDLHTSIWEGVDDVVNYNYDAEKFFEVQEKYENVLIKFAKELENHTSLNENTPNKDLSTMMKLPKIQLPKFDGNYLKWQQFYDLFNQLVHSQPMGNAQKMFYLKSNLAGEAERLIRHISVSDDNYSSAWEVLNNRYANKRLLVTALLERLLSQNSIVNESASTIRALHDVTQECVLGLENLGLSIYQQWDPIILHILLKKLDKSTHTLYEQSLHSPRELQSLKKFLEFLEIRFQSLEALGQRKTADKVKPVKPIALLTTKGTTKMKCNYCTKDHAIYYCDQFLKLSIAERQAAVKKLNLCLNCLKSGHRANRCSLKGCLKCHHAHNTLLHESFQEQEPKNVISSNIGSRSSANNKDDNAYVFLGTAAAFVKDSRGQLVKCRVLLDSGSQISFITEKLRQKLKIPSVREELNISGIGRATSKTSDRLNITLKSSSLQYETCLEVYAMKEITSYQPQKFINIENWNIPSNLALADPDFNKPEKIDILIGAELYGEIVLSGQIKLSENLPILQNTTLGWMVLGKVASTSSSNPFSGISNSELDDRMKQFWELEECTLEKLPNPADKRCEEFFSATTIRNNDGRYVVNMPIFSDPALLGNSANMAHRRLLNMEKKLCKQPELYKQYSEFLDDYLRLGHMKEINYEEIPKIHYFLPHHCVLKPTSSTTKLRVVFDASAKTTTNLSLNDLMVAGPRIQDELFDIILRFRSYQYVFTADIAQMYRQILINDEDRNLQLIMWRNNPSEAIKYFQLCTVTYGTKAAPYLATRCLQQLAEDEAIRFPLGATVIKDFYVDDIITGHDSLTEARKIQKDLDMMMKSGGFKLRKWCANHPALLEGIPTHDLELQIDFTENGDGHIKTLGLSWDPKRDCFKYTTSWPQRTAITKRTVLADISQLFDPLGLLNPVVVLGKIFMQQLWALGLGWDENLPDELTAKWLKFKEGLSLLNELKVGRHAIIGPMPERVELHAFADASEKAYGTAVYIRSTNRKGDILVKLLCAKSRVAPRKVTTLPRLELCAAKLAADLVQKILKTMTTKFDNIIYWSDSTIVLSWIHGDASTLKTFNANRVQKIQEVSSSAQWRYINTKLNPADFVSRGVTPQQLNSSANAELWFLGPSFLRTSEANWPSADFKLVRLPSEEREMKIVLNCINNNNVPKENFIDRIDHGNSFMKLQRVVAFILRGIKRFKRMEFDSSSFLKVAELDEALELIVKRIQFQGFQTEMDDLRKEGKVKNSSRIASLAPFIDKNGVLRVGGRLEEAAVAYDTKHPVLLPGDHIFSKLLMNHLHTQHLHAGPQALIAFSRQRYWITQGRALARSVVNSCVKCSRAKPQLLTQLMGNLPASRVLPGRAFLTTGVDFCGPIWTHYKLRGKRPTKSYVAVFCCFITKAIHLEVVSDLSTEAFIGALKRFVARRGLCRDIYCDNATNFVGTRNQLQEVRDMLENEQIKTKIADTCSQRRIQFHFSPPKSPHFGGLWEAAVKSFKQLLVKTVAPASLTYEELTTVVAEIEAILNSRPLTPMSSNPNDLDALTPGHFLVGEALTAVPNKEIEGKMSSLSRWKLVSGLTQEFWKRWTSEYLTELQKRLKWTASTRNIKIGTLVIIKDDNLPPLKWPMGRVIAVYPGADGLIRVTDVRTATGTYKRSIHNLCPLPIEPESELDNSEKIESHDNEPEQVDPSCQARKRSISESSDTNVRRRKRSSALSTLLLTCLLLPCSSFAAPIDDYVEIQPFNNQPGIYYERLGESRLSARTWKWYIYYDMTTYWNMLTTVEKGVKKLQILANMCTNPAYFKAIVTQYQHTLAEIEEINDLLLSHHGLKTPSRSRRGLINGVGMVARKLFGVLDEDYATEVAETIQKVQNNEDHLLQLFKNQTSVLEATEMIIRRAEDERLKQAKIIQDTFENNMEKIQNLEGEMRQQESTQTFLTLSTFIALIIAEYQKIQTTLLDTISDVHHGKMNTRIMSANKLRTQIASISEHLPASLYIPSRDISDLYQLMTVQCDVNENLTIFVVELPLALNINFELYKLIPLPSLINGTYVSIKPSTDLLMVNLERDSLYALTTLEFTHCALIGRSEYLCPQSHPIFDRNAEILQCESDMINKQKISDYCPITISTPAKTWIQLSNPNLWIFSLDREYVYNIVCDNNSFQKALSGNGVLKFHKGCSLRDDQLRINSQATMQGEISDTFFPNFDLTNNLSLPHGFRVKNQTHFEVSFQNHTQELANLHDKIRNLHENENMPQKLQIHDIHQYSIGYAALGIALILGICLGYIYYQLRSGQQPTPAPRQHNPHSERDNTFRIELKDFKGGEDVAANSLD